MGDVMPSSEHDSSCGADSPNAFASVDEKNKFRQLKEMLLGEERAALSDLEERLQSVESSREMIAALRAQVDALENEIVSRQEIAERIAEVQIDAEELSRLLPHAVTQASSRGDQLAASLGPTIANSFAESIRRDPQSLADAVSPIMGPAIRRSISQAIAAMVQSLNQTVQHSFSPVGLKWRWESFTTGKPFAEVVLLNSLVYMVEHAFLIRHEDGMVLAHVTSVREDETDADLVSGMLTALQDFVRDSLGGSNSDELEDMRVGDRNVFVERGTDAIVALVVRGTPPESIHESMQVVSEGIHVRYGALFAAYEGDAEPFKAAEAELSELLQSAYVERAKSSGQQWIQRIGWSTAAIVCVLSFVWLGFWLNRIAVENHYAELLSKPDSVDLSLSHGVLTLRGEAHGDWIASAIRSADALRRVQRVDATELVNRDQDWNDCLNALRSEPGIVVTDAFWNGCVYVVRGVQDPLARSAQSIIQESQLKPDQVRIEFGNFQAMDPQFVLARMRLALGDLDSVTWNLEGSKLTAEGEAPDAWCERAEDYARQTTAVHIDLSRVVNVERVAAIRLQKKISDAVIKHKDGSGDLEEGQDDLLDQVAEDIQKLHKSSSQLNEPIRIMVVGHADEEESSESPPQQLSEERARRVWHALVDRGIGPDAVVIRARGTGGLLSGKKSDLRISTFDVKIGL